MAENRKKIGFLINPCAGIGGKAGLKGSDDPEKIRELLERGCEKTAQERAKICISQIPKESECQIITAAGEMGAEIFEKEHLSCEVLPYKIGAEEFTTKMDTHRCVQMMIEKEVDLIVFCGGDGTARDVCEIVQTKVPVLGIPAGVKMYSACFAKNPYQAGELLSAWISGKEMSYELREVLDIEEFDLDNRNVSPRLYGFLKVPDDGIHLQRAKEADAGSNQVETVAEEAVRRMKKDWFYIIGPGGTTWKIKELLQKRHLQENQKEHLQECQKECLREIQGTVRGIDVVYNGEIVLLDASEEELWKLICKQSNIKIIVTCIGGNGFLFGRGNQQISARIIKKVGKEQIEIVATKEKLARLGGTPMHVDTGDGEVDSYLKGYYKIHFQENDSAVYKID